MQNWEHDLQLSIHCYYVGETEAGFRSSERILNSDAPDNVRYNALQNLTYYLSPVSEKFNVTYIPLNCKLQKEGWSCFNPTIINYENGYLVLVRNSNYKIDEHGRYIIPEEDAGIIKTEYVRLLLDKQFNLIEESKVKLPQYNKTNYPVDGLEDLRIFNVKNNYYVSGTIRNYHPHDGTCRIGLAPYNPLTNTIGDIEAIDLANGKHEKNWMPILDLEEIRWLYQSNENKYSYVINYKVEERGRFTILPCQFPAAKSFRGGSQLVKIKNNYYSIVHEAANIGNKRIYTHRIVEWDDEFKMTRFSKSFYLKEKSTIEFCSGMCFDGENVNFVFGVQDKEAYLASITLSDFESILSI